MARTSGTVQSGMASKNLRRKILVTRPIDVGAASTDNMVHCLLVAPTNSRIVIYSIKTVNNTAINNITEGTIKVGTATGAGTLTDNNIVASTNNTTKNTAQYVTNTAFTLASTLATSKHPAFAGYPIVPAGYSVWATLTKMASTGTGTIQIIVKYAELDDENA